ncbi:hypothetical protein [Microbacterium sp. LMI1x-1-1.1]|uniref:hypothetical protein n=1 Tax=Microbacterium sp. LMI1x-1-1.1 TaxID=3135246 RepID=UPI00344A5DFF
MESAETAEAAARSIVALWLSGGALGVAILAAGFTAWQAATEHLARVRPLKASWVAESHVALDPMRQYENGWYLTNIGGTTAVDVDFTVEMLSPRDPAESTKVFRAELPIPPGARVRLADTKIRPAFGSWWVPTSEPGTFQKAELDRAGDPVESNAQRLFTKWGIVSWLDEKGKQKKSRVALY